MSLEALREWDHNHVWHPFTPMQAWREESAPIIRDAEGFFLIDTDGERYLDGISSLWCNVHGHRVPEIDAAIRQQLDRVAHSTLLGLANEPSIELAKRLVEIAPEGLTKVFFSDAGATAVEAALKMAVQYHAQKPSGAERRHQFVRLTDAYHGDTIGSVSLGRMEAFHHSFGPLLFETLEVPSPVTFHRPNGYSPDSYIEFCYSELERTLRENANQIAAFVIEPLVQGAAGILVHPQGYLRRVRELTSELGILLIADEVAVGFGKTGSMFACEQEDVLPDILCMAKGLTGGYLPVAATLATDEIFDAFLGRPEEMKTFFHGHTFTGNPLGCAAAIANLDLFKSRNVIENVSQIQTRLEERFSEIADHPHVGEIRHKGVMVGIELVSNRETSTPFPKEQRIGHQVTLAARRMGTIIRPLGNVVVLMPAVGMPIDLLDQLCDHTFAAIHEVCGM